MKKIIPFIFILSLFLSFSRSKEISVKGFIKSFGNKPFNYAVIETEKGKQYSIKTDNSTKDELFKTVGSKIEITGILILEDDENSFNFSKDGCIELINWKIFN